MATSDKTNESAAEQPEKQDVGATPSGVNGANPSTAGQGKTDVNSNTPENGTGHINPSPEDSNITPSSAVEK